MPLEKPDCKEKAEDKKGESGLMLITGGNRGGTLLKKNVLRGENLSSKKLENRRSGEDPGIAELSFRHQ